MATRLARAIDWGTKLSGFEVTYYFAGSGEKTLSPFGKIVSAGFSAYEKAQFKQAFKLYASFTDLKFRQVKDPSAADFILATYEDGKTSLGAMGPPGYGLYSGYGVFNYRGIGWDNQEPGQGGLEQGGYGFVTVIHELGHGLGLAHPHDKGGRSTILPGVSDSQDPGAFGLNQGVYTTMSYNDGWKTNPDGLPPGYDYGYQGTPMAIDIAVLQAKYGVNDSHHKGANVYRLPDVNESGTFYRCIWDAGGRDAIVSDSAAAATIDLRAATLKPEPGGGGYVSRVDGIFGGFTIAHGVTIEDARGGAGDDVIVGNAARNRLDGGAGDDIIFGRGGNDRLTGGAGADRLYGGKGADKLVGGAGNDVLIGGAGADLLSPGAGSATLSGGKGADIFKFKVSPIHGDIVTIMDFTSGRDVIHLVAQAFAGIGSKGGLVASAFALGSHASDLSDRILYDPATGAVRHDPDGTGESPAVQFAKLGAGLGVSHTDFIVVA